MTNEMKLPPNEDTSELVQYATDLYKKWLENGIHYELEYVYYRIEDRYHDTLKSYSLPKNEMKKLYRTIGDWMDNEYTGSSFNFPKFENEIYYFVDDWIYDKFFEINKGQDRDEIEDFREESSDEVVTFREKIIYELIGTIDTDKI